MKMLADENLESIIVDWLRETGHDVIWTAEIFPSSPDEEVLHTAKVEDRVLVTNDLDFGSLVYLKQLVTAGVILLRYRAATQEEKLSLLQHQWDAISKQPAGSFVVASNKKVRSRPIST